MGGGGWGAAPPPPWALCHHIFFFNLWGWEDSLCIGESFLTSLAYVPLAPSTRSRVFWKTETFSSVFKKSASTRSVFKSYVRRANLEPRHDVIVFENLRFRPSTRIRYIYVFKNLHPGERIWKPSFSVPENAGSVWTSPFSKIPGYV